MTKYSWTEEDNRICSEGYLNDIKPVEVQKMLPHISLSSIRYKYCNCKFLDKGEVSGALCNVSKLHIKVWKTLIDQRKNENIH